MKSSFYYFRLITTFSLLGIVACSKEIKENAPPQEEELAAKADPCTGNKWVMGENFYSHGKGFGNVPPSLVYNNKIYVFDAVENEIRIFDGSGWDSLQSLNDVPYFNENTHVGFTIGNKMYLGYTSLFGEYLEKRFYEYDVAANTWNRVADFTGPSRTGATVCTFVIGNKAYVMGGNGSTGPLKDLWEYDQVSNSWSQRANLPFFVLGRAYATGFSIGGKGYVVNGQVHGGTTAADPGLQTLARKTWEYDPVDNDWTEKASFPGVARVNTSVFVLGTSAYAGAGAATSNFSATTFYKDFYRFVPATNSWTKLADVTVNNPSKFGFAINGRGYFVFKTPAFASPDFMMRYAPKVCFGTTPIN